MRTTSVVAAAGLWSHVDYGEQTEYYRPHERRDNRLVLVRLTPGPLVELRQRTTHTPVLS